MCNALLPALNQVLSSPVPLKVLASSLDTLSPVLLHSWADKHDLIECLKASATVPQIAGQWCKVRCGCDSWGWGEQDAGNVYV